jgi:hypothetical protein
MTVWVLLLIILVLIGINIFLWKSGFLFQAENPIPVNDIPVKNPKDRRAFLKRLQRWREEGKISRAEFEKLSELADQDWDRGDVTDM